MSIDTNDLDLWPDDISVDVVTPLAILRAQVAPLQRKTKGLLRVHISTLNEPDTRSVVLQMALAAPSLSNYKEGILTATHDPDRVYPVRVEADCFAPGEVDDQYFDRSPMADSEQAFITIVAEVLRSKSVRSLIESLLARINEQTSAPPTDSPENQ